jgi:hypothetical protein
VAEPGTPLSITADDGSEVLSKAMDAWAYQHGVQLDFIRPGRPVENSYIESLTGRLRDEYLNVEVFFALADLRKKLVRWRQVRAHSSLADRAPEVFAKAWQQTLSSASERIARPADRMLACAVQGPEASGQESLQPFGSPSADTRGEAAKLLTEVVRSDNETGF